jgi:serine/threonine protein kinase
MARTNKISWHADIKPDNILIVHGKFKLADPGFVKFVEKTESNHKSIQDGGTETFGKQF